MPDLDQQLRTYIGALADEIDEGVADAVAIVSRDEPIEGSDEIGARRPRVLLAVAAAMVALVVAGAIAWFAGDSPLSVDVDTADDSTTTAPGEGNHAEPGVSGGSVVIVDERLYPGPDPFNGDFAVPWRGGTLSLETVSELGQPPDDILTRYPVAIQELWADGLPTTAEEAEHELRAAGLEQLGLEVAEGDPVLRDWFLGATAVAQLRHTIDGVIVDTTSLEAVALPLRDVQTVVSDGERLVVAGMGMGPFGVVAVTRDLRTWTTHVLVDPTPAGAPDGSVFAPDNAEVSISEWGWMVLGSPYLIGLDPEYLVGLGLIGADEEVVSVDLAGGGRGIRVGTNLGTYDFAAADLKIDAGLLSRSDPANGNTSAWAAPWDGVPIRMELPPGAGADVVGVPSGFYVQLATEDPGSDRAFAVAGDGWHEATPPPGPGQEVDSAGTLGIVSGELLEGGGARIWLSEDLGRSWRSVELRGLEGHTTGLDLYEWPVIRSFYRQDASADFDEGRVVVTAWFSTGEDGLVEARLENPVSGELLAERNLTHVRIGEEFEFRDASGEVLLVVPGNAIDSDDFDRPTQAELSALSGPSWEIDTTTEPWVAVPIP